MKVRAVGVVQDVTTGDMEIVSALIAALKERVGAERCGLWFGKQTRLSLRGQTLRVDVANAFFQDWLRSNFRRDLEICSEQLLGQAATIEFHVDPKLADPDTAAETDASEAEVETAVVANAAATMPIPTSAMKTAADVHRNGDHRNGDHRNGEPHRTNGRPETRKRRFADFSTFVVGPSNQIARISAQDVVDQPGRRTPLYVYGGTGVGKTHLLESIVTATREASPKMRCLFVTAEQFTTHYVEAKFGNGFANLRSKYRNPELLIVDDIHFFIGKTQSALEFQQTIDAILRKGRQVVLAGNVSPGELDALGPELTSRIIGGACVEVDAPDHAVRLGIVKQLCQRNELELDEEIQQMIAARLTDNARQLSGAINRLHLTSRAMGERMTLVAAERALSDMTLHSGRVVHLPEIEKAVADVFGLQPDSLKSGRKSRAVTEPRQLAMWLARRHTRSALSEVGDYFGRRSHTTVISAQKKINGMLTKNAPIGGPGQHMNTEEAIRRVEAKLRVG